MSNALSLDLNEEQFHNEILKIERKVSYDERQIIRRLSLDRNSLLLHMKVIAEALEDTSSDGNPIEEVAQWAREAYEEMVLG